MAARDIIVVGIILFVFAMAFFVIKFTADTAITSLVAIPQINQSTATVTALQGSQTNVNNRLDGLFFGVFIGLVIAMIITSWFVGANPIFLFIYFIIALISVVTSTVFADTWQSITQASVFGTTISTMPLTNHIISYLPIYLTVLSFIGIIVMYAKPYITGEQQ